MRSEALEVRVADVIRRGAERRPERVALRHGERTLTYAQLDERSSRLAQLPRAPARPRRRGGRAPSAARARPRPAGGGARAPPAFPAAPRPPGVIELLF